MILDEFELAEQIMTTKRVDKRSDLFILAKYLRNEVGFDEDESFSVLNNVLSHFDKKYNPVKSANYLMKMIKKAENYKLRKVEDIHITQSELGKIESLDNLKLQRLLFTLLVYAKFNNALSGDNNNWCNVSINELYKTAKVSTRNSKEKALLLKKLKDNNLISFSKKNTNLNVRISFVDENIDEHDLIISDLRELGYQYLNLTQSEQFTKCLKCGVLIKKKSKSDHSTKYCGQCVTKQNIENKRNSFSKTRQSQSSENPVK